MAAVQQRGARLADHATVAIVGGGPAGSFLALHLLEQSRRLDRPLRVVIFERRRRPPRGDESAAFGPYQGCPRCAGGVSPRLSEALDRLGLEIPRAALQARVRAITVQGDWKPILLQVPRGRRMLSVYRGTLPKATGTQQTAFDGLLLDAAVARGAELIGRRVRRVAYDGERRPVLHYRSGSGEAALTADFAAFAGGVNERTDARAERYSSVALFRMLQPSYEPPAMRKALIVELEAPAGCEELIEGHLHYLESSVDELRLDMCSIMPKRDYFTVSLIGGSVDEAASQKENRALIRRFLATDRVRAIMPQAERLQVRCVCNPAIVVGTAKRPFGHRVAVVGDLATSRQYKDGMLAAHDMARDLTSAVFRYGIDEPGLAAGYGPTLARFRRDNRYASIIFFLYRWFFTRPSLSRVIYQTFASERKSELRHRRSFERIFWDISSGDENYEQIAWAMLRPATLWKILRDGVYVTLRNRATERFFGLDWTGIIRYPTAVPAERLHVRRRRLHHGRSSEFECIYTIQIRAPAADVRRLLTQFGEPRRPYLHPRFVHIGRAEGEPLEPGCRIRYRVFGGAISFAIVQEDSGDDNLVRYRVEDGFAGGGTFIFLIEPKGPARSALTVYLAFDYPRGDTLARRLIWRFFRLLFPEYLHDVLWNHALCEFKQQAEQRRADRSGGAHRELAGIDPHPA